MGNLNAITSSSSLVNLTNIIILLVLLGLSAVIFVFGLLVFTQLGLMTKTLITPVGKYFKFVSLGICGLAGLVIAYIGLVVNH